jgi:Domain of unknown function (DUF222)
VTATGHAVPMRQVMDTIEKLAEQLQRDGDTRPVGCRRITAMQRLILGEATTPLIEAALTLDLNAYLGHNNRPGELSGYGPISADTARILATDASLRRLITDPLTGTMIDLGRTRYRPSTTLQRILNHRDRSCRFPGCSRPATRCDNDHITPLNHGGQTRSDQMHALCRRHHNLKTKKYWHIDLNPDGTETWTSAAGFRYTKPAPTYPLPLTEPPDNDPPEPPEDQPPHTHPDPATADDPLPDTPPITLEEYLTYSDQLERDTYFAANQHYDSWRNIGLAK